MKTRKQSSDKTSPALELASFRPVQPLEDVTAAFIAKQKQSKKTNGSNDCLNDFMKAAALLSSQ